MRRVRRTRWLASLLACSLLAGCGGGGGTGGGAFAVVAANVFDGEAGWRLNRALRVRFNRPLDPASVTHTTVNVRLPDGTPAFGTVSVDPDDPRALLWQPDCPTLDDLSDAGLRFGVDPATGSAHRYELALIGADEGAFTLRSADGDSLPRSFHRSFSTPSSTLFADLFVDDVVGPPQPVLREGGAAGQRSATHLRVGGAQHDFVRWPDGSVTLEPPLELPLNLYADQGTEVVLMLQLDQSVDMRSSNLSTAKLGLEFEAAPGDWRPLAVDLELEDNCSLTGARVRVAPLGVLPPSTALRPYVGADLADLVGDTNGFDLNGFASARTESTGASGGPGGPVADHFLESFAGSQWEQAGAGFAEPAAVWGAGELRARFSFDGSGGPGGDFDLRVQSGEVLILSTVQATVTGGPGFAQQKQYTSVGGVFDLHNLRVESGGVIKFEGPNPVTLLLSGDLEVHGQIILDGTGSKGVQSTNTTALPEVGGPGQAGGGTGGTGSYLTTFSTPRGGSGQGAFGGQNLGGEGGDTGWANAKLPFSLRRAGGGGGGTLGRDELQQLGSTATFGVYDQSRIGLDAEPGFDNLAGQAGANSGPGPVRGGRTAGAPFLDNDPSNDFFGFRRDLVTGQVVEGELKRPWAGAGGGAGGDASFVGTTGTYPPKWSLGGDEKGAGGGGGGGSLRVLALGDIRFVGAGRILARGGAGGGGENVNRTSRVGGGSGGGSGGHVVLETAGSIDLSQATLPAILAVGGQGGAGENDRGGAFISNQGPKQTGTGLDACPVGYPSSGPNACLGQVDGAGGDGGPGIVQLHASQGVGVDILLPTGATLADVSQPAPLGSDGSGLLLPAFGRFSRARSRWIPLGEGGLRPGTGTYGDVSFDFDGLDASGFVLRDAAGAPQGLPPILSANSGAGGSTGPLLGHALSFDAAPLAGTSEQVLLDRPELLRGHLVELRDPSLPTRLQRFEVVDARYDPAGQRLDVDLDPNGPALESFLASAAPLVELQPAFFRVATDGVLDSLPPSTDVQIRFEATDVGPAGGPALPPLVPWTSDAADLNFPGNAGLRYLRFEVLFDVDRQLTGLSPDSPLPALDYLRIPFRYP